MKLYLFQIINVVLRNKEIINAYWIIVGKAFQMILSLFVGLLTTRYLGPSNYGLINYGASYVALFASICSLGINSVIIKEFADYPEEQGTTIGTALCLKAFASLFSAIMIVSFVCIIDQNDSLTIVVTALCSISLLFHIFDTFNYWFQFRYKSKVTAIITLLAYIIVSIYKIILLHFCADVKWFALSTSIDYIVVAILLFASYLRNGGQRIRVSWTRGKHILFNSYHYILAGIMVSIYAQTDKLMLARMLNQASVGYYSVATTICGIWTFVLAAIIDSIYPTIIRLFNNGDVNMYIRKNKQLYSIIFYVSISVSIIFLFGGKMVVRILYGDAFLPAVLPLKVISLYTAFSYLGTARNAWIICEKKQNYLIYIYVGAALTNVCMNLIFIPALGETGAAIASLITQINVCFFIPLFINELRPNVKLMCDAILLKIK